MLQRASRRRAGALSIFATTLFLLSIAIGGPVLSGAAASSSPQGAGTGRGSESQESPIARAIRFRQDNGLRADRPYVESVEADPAAKREFSGVALTSEEVKGLLARQEAITPILGPLTDELQKDSSFAGIYIDQAAGGVVVISTTADPSHLAPALANFGSRGVGLRVRQVQYTLAELHELQERVNRDARQWTDRGVRLSSWGVDIIATGSRLVLRA